MNKELVDILVKSLKVVGNIPPYDYNDDREYEQAISALLRMTEEDPEMQEADRIVTEIRDKWLAVRKQFLEEIG